MISLDVSEFLLSPECRYYLNGAYICISSIIPFALDLLSPVQIYNITFITFALFPLLLISVNLAS